MSDEPADVGSIAQREMRRRRQKRQVVVELYRRESCGKLVSSGSVVTEYEGDRRGGAVRESPRSR